MTASETRTSGLHLLLVEDDDGDALLVEELLDDAGLDTEVTRAWSLEAALDALVVPVDCVLLDLGLPDASGLDALVRLRDASASAVVVLTGLDDADRGLEAVGAGADDYLVKGSVDGEALGRAVRYAVERRRADRDRLSQQEVRARAEEVVRLAEALRPGTHVPSPAVRTFVRSDPAGPLSPLLCDVVERPDGSVLAITGTAEGDRAQAAALAVSVRASFRALALTRLSVPDLVVALDRSVATSDGATVGVVVVEMRPQSRAVVCHLAGHHPPLLLSAGEVGPLAGPAERGSPLGTGTGPAPTVTAQLLEQDRLLLLHSEVLEHAGAMVGEPSSLAAVLDAATRGGGDDSALADTVERAVRAYVPGLTEVQLVLLGWGPA